MTEVQTIDAADIICGLKAATTALECHYNMQLLKQQKEDQKSRPMYMMIPIEESTCYDKKISKHQKKDNIKYKPPRQVHPVKTTKKDGKDLGHDTLGIDKLNFPEMRGGILHSRCSCVHRDGLQDHCPLTQCQGQPKCLVKPWPLCPPGKYVRSRYSKLYPP